MRFKYIEQRIEGARRGYMPPDGGLWSEQDYEPDWFRQLHMWNAEGWWRVPRIVYTSITKSYLGDRRCAYGRRTFTEEV